MVSHAYWETYLALELQLVCCLLLRVDHCAASALHKRRHTRLKLHLHPLHVLNVQHEHVRHECTRLRLAAIDNHRFLIHCRTMVLTRASRETCCLALGQSSLVSVELQQLVGAFAHLAFLTEHEAAAESIDLTTIRA